MNFFDLPNKPLQRKNRQRTATVALEREEIPFVEFTDEELYAAKGGVLLCDTEEYPNYFICAFKCYYTNKVVYFERSKTLDFNAHKLLWVMHNFVIITFNGINFDMPIIWLALNNHPVETLKNVANFIIKEKMRPSDIERMYNFKQGSINHIDLLKVAPGKGSLKAYGARLHAQRLQDLPYAEDTPLDDNKIKIVRNYCINDLDVTGMLLKKLSPQLDLRAALSKQYNIDLRSKSDAQIAEAVIMSEVQKIKGYYPKRPKIETGTIYKYSLPKHIRFQNSKLNEMLFEVANANFEIGLSKKEGQIVLSPKELEDRIVKIGNTEYRLGIGGIHSCEKSICHVADEQTLLCDVDVESYYPRLILNQNLYPEQIGPCVLEIFDGIVETRLTDKHNAKYLAKLEEEKRSSTFKEDLEKAITGANSKKIIINSYYGKLNDNWSRLRSPGHMIQVTLTGQLSLLMLIEYAELNGIPAVSANTDGIVFKCPINKYELLKQIVIEWEKITQFKTEETRYKAVYSANVNNYLAVQLDGKIKAKGWYADEGISKNPVNAICVDAVTNLISHNIAIEETVRNCTDIGKFVNCRAVKGGAEHNEFYLGKIVRFYMSKSQGTINYITSGNKVPDSEGAKPLMDLGVFPNDINYEWYIARTTRILQQIGYLKTEKQQKFF